MGSLVMQEFKKHASFFFKEKIKTARLALTDATPVQLLTEEATDGSMLSPSACDMAVISRAAFEVDDYWRIVIKFDTRNWVNPTMLWYVGAFVNSWSFEGSTGIKCEKIIRENLETTRKRVFLKEERSRARKLTVGIKGFGSFNQISSSNDESFDNMEN
ncbi:Actin-11 isoform 1 [Hibiscus syriacus]|uniref:Actin-11 isoform 1 n=1 Tax=Hibiscus syriacus TaxID=106335 RepID=A0A6A2ZET3_HIBSY|nr:Actin-11 isoform 1 [Hibiscus syriacus]